MKFKKIISVCIMLAVMLSCFVPFTHAANVSLTTDGLANGVAKYTLIITESNEKGIGALDCKLKISGKVKNVSVSAPSTETCLYNDASNNLIVVLPAGVSTKTLVVNIAISTDSDSVGLAVNNIILGDLDGKQISLSQDKTSVVVAGNTAPTEATTRKPRPTKPNKPMPTYKPAKPVAPVVPGGGSARPVKKSNLKALSVAGYELEPKFSPNKSSYKVMIPKNLANLEINAVPVDKNAVVTIEGNKNMKPGVKSTIKVLVEATDGTSRTYYIRTVFDENAATNGPKLNSLTIKPYGYDQLVVIDFTPTVLEYDIEVPEDVNALDIQTTVDENTTVNVVGADDLAANGNQVLIEVLSDDGEVSTYTLNVSYVKADTNEGLPIWAIIIIALLAIVILILIIVAIIKKIKGGNGGNGGKPENPYDYFTNMDDEVSSGDMFQSGSNSPFRSISFGETGAMFASNEMHQIRPEAPVASPSTPVANSVPDVPMTPPKNMNVVNNNVIHDVTPPATVAPVAPVTPVAPVEPELPVQPVVEPVAPVEPELPVQPAVEPVAPVEPELPVQPAVEPVAPVEPELPTQAEVTPIEPEVPVEPETPKKSQIDFELPYEIGAPLDESGNIRIDPNVSPEPTAPVNDAPRAPTKPLSNLGSFIQSADD